jgi:hypothetical protein
MTFVDFIDSVTGYIKKGWARGRYARDINGGGTSYSSPNAVCWCLEGAIYVAGETIRDRPYKTPYEFLLKEKICNITGNCSVADWNDRVAKGQDDVLDVLDRVKKVVVEERELYSIT